MKIPINWLRDYVNVSENLKEFTDKMSMIGHLLDKTEEVNGETVVDLELRGNRADCYSIIGIARESHAAFGGKLGIENFELRIPSFDSHSATSRLRMTNNYENFSVEVETPVVKRFYSTVIKNIKVGSSPEWMQKKLKAYGIDPINNIVDITNFVMVESGMPMHAFDLNRMDGKKLILRHANKDEKFTTFDGTELKLTTEDVVFGSENRNVLGIAGVIGGKESGIHEDTTEILLECAGYDRVSIRKSMFRHKAMTDAGLRHSHDLSSSLCDFALQRAIDLVIELACSGEINSIQGVHDYYPEPEQNRVITFDPNEVTRLGGVVVDLDTQIDILRRLEFVVESNSDRTLLNVVVPLFRTEIFESADIVEEVLRIFGYENIPSTTLSSVIPDPIVQPELVIEEKSKDILTALGLDEIITVPMSTPEKLQKTNDSELTRSITLVNPSSSEHTTLRTNMLTGLLDATARVLDRGDEKVTFFETGKVYLKKKQGEIIHQPPHKPEFPYIELRKIAVIIASKNSKEFDFSNIKGLAEQLLNELGIKNLEFKKIENSQYDLCAEISQNEINLGLVGIIAKEVCQNFGIKQNVLAFTLSVDAMVNSTKTKVNYEPYSDFPPVKQDMSVVVESEKLKVESSNLIKTAKNIGSELLRNVEITDVYETENQRSLLLSMTYQAKDRTLSTEEVNLLHTKIGDELKKSFGVEIKGRETQMSEIKVQGSGDQELINISHNELLDLRKEEIVVVPDKVVGNEKQETLRQAQGDTVYQPQEKVVVGRVLEIAKHPNADRLVICKIDVGYAKPSDSLFADYLQIVTGAENIKPGIAEGKIIPVALPGAIVTSHKDGSSITIKVGQLRGETSEGMLCSSDELHLPNPGYDGILILDESYSNKIGTKFEINNMPVDSLGSANQVEELIDSNNFAEAILESPKPKITTLIFDWSKVCTKAGMADSLSSFLSEKLGKTKEEVNTALKLIGNGYLAGIQSGEQFLEDILQTLDVQDVAVESIIEALTIDSEVNEDVLDFIKSLKNKYNLILFADCPVEKSEFIVQKYQLDEVFDKLVFSHELGAVRPERESYGRFIETVGINPEESLVIDDRIDNLNVAKEFGLQTLMYVSLQVLKDALKNSFGLEV